MPLCPADVLGYNWSMRSVLLGFLAVLAAVVCTGTLDPTPTLIPISPTPAPDSPTVSQPVSTPTHALSPTPVTQLLPLRAMEVERAFPDLSFDRPVALVFPGDGSGRGFLVEQPGQVMALTGEGNASPFLDIRGRVSDRGNEEGLLGLAFDPDFVSNGYFYVYYTAGSPRRSVISRFTVSPDGPEIADEVANPDSELIILEVGQPFSNHNGGQILFGPDGLLYIALGDGGSAGDPGGNGQNTGTLLGSILRLDVSTLDAMGSYAIPSDNPLLGVKGARPEIWAYGLRNPWRFTFDRETGDLWAADVGQDAFEEVDLIRPGLNYGWNVMEGESCFRSPGGPCDRAGLEPPVAVYGAKEGCSIIGGYVYRGSRLPGLYGAYVYGDFCSGKIWAFRYDDSGITGPIQLADTRISISSFAEDTDGELYILSLSGEIYRFAE